MKEKIPLISTLLILILVVSLSGCIGRAASDAGTCCVLSIIGLVLFIILIAYLLGGKETVVQTTQTTQTTPPPPVVIYKETSPPEREKTKHDRRCPSCGRVIPDDAELCPYCGKKFELHFKEYCPECGFQIVKSANYCEECGNKLV